MSRIKNIYIITQNIYKTIDNIIIKYIIITIRNVYPCLEASVQEAHSFYCLAGSDQHIF